MKFTRNRVAFWEQLDTTKTSYNLLACLPRYLPTFTL